MFTVYILYSKQIDKYYVGQTEDLPARLLNHNSGKSPYTSRSGDWQIVYSEVYSDKCAALKRELAIKRKKSRLYIEWLISEQTWERFVPTKVGMKRWSVLPKAFGTIFSTKPHLGLFLCVIFYVYILFSETKDRYYVGQTDNLETRLLSHNSGKSPCSSISPDGTIN